MSNVQEALKSSIETLERLDEWLKTLKVTGNIGLGYPELVTLEKCKVALSNIEKCKPVGQVVNANDEFPGIGTYGHMHIELPNETKLYDKPQPREGWVSVPIEPTREMLEAAGYHPQYSKTGNKVYAAFIQAAPKDTE